MIQQIYGQLYRQLELYRTFLMLVCLLHSITASASSFMIDSQSAGSTATALSGVSTGANGITDIYYNPAILNQLHGKTGFSIGFSYVDINIGVESVTANTALGTSVESTVPASGAIGTEEWIPNLYFKQQLNSAWSFGLSIAVPYGLSVEYASDWPGRYFSVLSEVESLEINPMVSWQITEKLSLGMGARAQYFTAEFINKLDIGSFLFANTAGLLGAPGSLAQDASSTISVDDWAAGYNLGLFYAISPNTHFGISFRSKISHNLTGDIDVNIAADNPIQLLPGGTDIFSSSACNTEITTPETINLGIAHQATERWRVLANARWVNWSRLKELAVSCENPNLSSTQNYQWQDSMMWSLGSQYHLTDRVKLNMGLAISETPTTDQYRTPNIPASDALWVAFGAAIDLTRSWALQLGYTHEFFREATVDLQNPSLGTLNAEYDNDVNVFSVNLEWMPR